MIHPDNVDTQRDRQRLIDRYGPAEILPRSVPLLRALGCDHDDAVVVRYPCVESAEGFGRLNRRRWGHRVLGPFMTESGVLAVVDFRAMKKRLEAESRRRR